MRPGTAHAYREVPITILSLGIPWGRLDTARAPVQSAWQKANVGWPHASLSSPAPPDGIAGSKAPSTQAYLARSGKSPPVGSQARQAMYLALDDTTTVLFEVLKEVARCALPRMPYGTARRGGSLLAGHLSPSCLEVLRGTYGSTLPWVGTLPCLGLLGFADSTLE